MKSLMVEKSIQCTVISTNPNWNFCRRNCPFEDCWWWGLFIQCVIKCCVMFHCYDQLKKSKGHPHCIWFRAKISKTNVPNPRQALYNTNCTQKKVQVLMVVERCGTHVHLDWFEYTLGLPMVLNYYSYTVIIFLVFTVLCYVHRVTVQPLCCSWVGMLAI